MYALLLRNQLQLSVLVIVLLALYSYRHVLGQAPLYAALGTYCIFAVIADSPRIVNLQPSSILIEYLGHGLLWMPFLLFLIIVYELEGTREAQRFLLALICVALCFTGLFMIIHYNLSGTNRQSAHDFFAFSNLILSDRGRMGIIVGTLTHFFIFILAPVVYQAGANRGMRFGLSILFVFLSYVALQEAFMAIYVTIMLGYNSYQIPEWQYWLVRILSACWVALIGHIFLTIHSSNVPRRMRRALNFISSMMTMLSSDRLMRSIDEWSERYQLVVENSIEMILITDAEGRVINANGMAAQAFGEVLAQPDFTADKVISDQQGTPWNWQEAIKEDLLEGTSPAERRVHQFTNLVLRRPGATPKDLEINLSTAAYNGEHIVIFICRDVTEQKLQERQRLNQLDQQMHSQRLEAIGELAGGIAHDFNNLMQSVQASLDALKMRYTPSGKPKELLDNVDEACQRAITLTSQLLGFAHKGKYNATDVDVRSLLEHSLKLFLPSAKGIKCKVICEPVPMMIHVDEIQLSQVIMNMLINSRDALAECEGPKRITIRAESVTRNMPEWDFRSERDADPDKYICIHIRDNGCGMTDEVKTKIFDPFFTTKPAGKGTGMGLPMAFGCITSNKGWLHVETEVGKGTDITIFLPRANA